MDLDPQKYWSAGYGSRRATILHKYRKKWSNLIFSAGCSLLRACTILTSWRLKDKYIVIFDEKNFNYPRCSKFLVIKPLDPDPHWPKKQDTVRIRIETNADLQYRQIVNTYTSLRYTVLKYYRHLQAFDI